MAKVKSSSCLGEYQPQGQCESCPLALLCIDATIAINAYWDEQASSQKEIEEMEADRGWTQR